MDPNTNREEQLQLAAKLMWAIEADRDRVDLADVLRLTELVLALDEWLSRGGFPPRAWRPR